MLEGDRPMIWFEEGGWWLPDQERHLQAWMLTVNMRFNGRLTYQRKKYLAALQWVKHRRVALDIGAHVGLWSWQMAPDFAQVIAYEPKASHRECFERNTADCWNVQLRTDALGDRNGISRIVNRTPDSSGDTGIDPDPASTLGEEVRIRRLDDTDPPLDMVDLVKIDCEGFELFVVRGAAEMLKRCKPCVIVEQKPETGMADRYGTGVKDAVTFLQSLGAQPRTVLQGDHVMSWN